MLWPPQARPVATVDSSMSDVIPVAPYARIAIARWSSRPMLTRTGPRLAKAMLDSRPGQSAGAVHSEESFLVAHRRLRSFLRRKRRHDPRSPGRCRGSLDLDSG